MTDMAQRRALVVAAGESVRLGLNHGTTGNLSVRSPGGFLIIPTGSRCDRITAADLVAMDLDGNVRGGGGAPSSEWRLHRDLYQARPDVGGVVHSHPVFATTLACHRMHLPAVHYMIAVTGASSVQCARYATFGTAELSDAVLEAIGAARACLLANHGMVAVGADLGQALRVATEVESVAELYWRALQIGTPTILSDAELAAVHAKFASYGPPAPPPP